MKEWNEDQIRKALRRAFPPMADTEPRQDLWPQMLRKVDERQPVSVPWLDWALLAALPIWCLYFPQAIPGLFFNL